MAYPGRYVEIRRLCSPNDFFNGLLGSARLTH